MVLHGGGETGATSCDLTLHDSMLLKNATHLSAQQHDIFLRSHYADIGDTLYFPIMAAWFDVRYTTQDNTPPLR